ncbi:MAG: dihydroorotate dehydrogenase electron transfer subunit [Candidatus Thermoplasmatota archaeon]|nr:dihydroorotate dehydrogenase electron transfer subunit [Candidatus Thermoplasmatota archaeon]
MSYPRVAKIIEIKEETKDVKTLRFKYNEEVQPGQFFMVWIPGVDELPMSASYTGDLKGITVEKVGDATSALHRLKPGAKIGIRGPYGNGFKIFGRKILFVAGGTGIIPIAPLVEKLKKQNVAIVFGAKSKNELFFIDRIKRTASKLLITTDDGSSGEKALASELAEKILEMEKFDQIITCGPERMMKKILDLGLKNKIPVQASLERWMKCGIGICDSCAIDGLHVCKDGPVFDGKILRRLKEFGEFKRDASGRRIKL